MTARRKAKAAPPPIARCPACGQPVELLCEFCYPGPCAPAVQMAQGYGPWRPCCVECASTKGGHLTVRSFDEHAAATAAEAAAEAKGKP